MFRCLLNASLRLRCWLLHMRFVVVVAVAAVAAAAAAAAAAASSSRHSKKSVEPK